MTESLASAVARLDQKLDDLGERITDNYKITKESREAVDKRLDKMEDTLAGLLVLSSEWAGVRKTLTAAGVVIGLISGAIGAAGAWLKYGK